MKPYHYIVTGIPRSGTSLLCHLLNQIDPNVVCMNEIPMLYNVEALPSAFNQIHSLIQFNQKVPMLVNDETSQAITDTQSGKTKVALIDINIDVGKDLYVGSKINVPYLLNLDKMFAYGYKVIAMVRDPVYAIASWNKHKNINEQYVMPKDFEKWPRYSSFDFKTDDKISRQAELWSYLATIILGNARQLYILKYEDLIKDVNKYIKDCMDYLGYDEIKVGFATDMNLNNLNSPDRFPGQDLSKIREAIAKHCESKFFNYQLKTRRPLCEK
jgi:hypothetical protein